MRLLSTSKINHCLSARLIEVIDRGTPYYVVAVFCFNPADSTATAAAVPDMEKTFVNQAAAKIYVRQLRREYKNA